MSRAVSEGWSKRSVSDRHGGVGTMSAVWSEQASDAARDVIALDGPLEIVPLFLFRRKDGIEVGNERDIAGRASAARKHEVIAEFREARRDVFGREVEWGETLRCKACELIHASAIRGKAVDAHHAFKQAQCFGQ